MHNQALLTATMATESVVETIVEQESSIGTKEEEPSPEPAIEPTADAASQSPPQEDFEDVDIPEEKASEPDSEPAPEPEPEPGSELGPEPEPVIEAVKPEPQSPNFITEQLSGSLSQILLATFDTVSKYMANRAQNSEVEKLDSEDAEDTAVISEEIAKPSPPNAFKVPHARNPGFVGRISALSQLFGMWNPGHTSQARIAIVGLGGTGLVFFGLCSMFRVYMLILFRKTELAIEFVHRVRHISPTTPINWFSPDDLKLVDEGVPGSKLQEFTKTNHGSETMLVLDTGDDFDILLEVNSDSGRLIDKLHSFEGTIILLARSSQNASEITGSHGICELGDLEVEASVILFRDHLSPEASSAPESQIQEVVSLMAYLPRAIIQAAELISHTGMKVSQFLDMYQRADHFKLRMLGKLDPVSSPEHNISVIGRGVFDVRRFRKTYHKFSQFLYQLYFLGGDSVPWKIFSSADPLDMVITMVLLKGHFLVTGDPSNETYSFHPLVYLAIRNSLGTGGSTDTEDKVLEEQQWYEDIVLAFSREYPDSNQDSRSWWKDCFAHLIGGYSLSNDSLKAAVATVYHRESKFFKRKGMLLEALKMIELARHTLPDPTPPEQLTIVQDHVSLLFSLAKYRDMHEVLQRISPEKGSGVLWKKRMQAKLEQADCANRYDTAIDMFRQVLLSAETSDESETSTSSSMDDLGMALMHKGRYRDAASECRKALAERKTSLGSSYPDTLTSCHNLAEILKRDGQIAEALRYIQGALVGRESILGLDHPETVHSRFVKASILRCKAVSTMKPPLFQSQCI